MYTDQLKDPKMENSSQRSDISQLVAAVFSACTFRRDDSDLEADS